MSDTPPTETGRVTTLELFFDLVFVFAITQLTTVLVKEPTVIGLLRAILMLGVIWWMYGGYAWLTNAVAPDRWARRVILLGGTAAFLILALTIPRAYSDGGRAFGLAYIAVVIVHTVLFTHASSENVVRAIWRIAPFNLTSALLVLAAGSVGGRAEYILWGLAFGLEWITPSLSSIGGFEIAPAHFVERHQLVVLIAIGESVAAVGAGALGLPVDLPLVGITTVGLLLNACLWWAYFGADDRRAEEYLTRATPDKRPRLALVAFGYWHLLLLLGIIVAAAALRGATGHAFAPLPLPQALALSGGVSLFLLGDVFYRDSLGMGIARWRVIAAGAVLVVIPVGLTLAAIAQVATIACLLLVTFAVEHGTATHADGHV